MVKTNSSFKNNDKLLSRWSDILHAILLNIQNKLYMIDSFMLRAQLRPTPWDLMDYRPPRSSVHGISEARILEWIGISYSRRSSQPRDWPASPALPAESLPLAPPGSLQIIVKGAGNQRTWANYCKSNGWMSKIYPLFHSLPSLETF